MSETLSLGRGGAMLADFPRRRPDGSSFLEPVGETVEIQSSRDSDKRSKPRDLRTDLANAISTVDSMLHSPTGTRQEFYIARKYMRTLMDEAIDYDVKLSDFGVSKSSFTLRDERSQGK